MPIHIIQGGIENGDKTLLNSTVESGAKSLSWVVPKSAKPGDVVIIYIGGIGFFATAYVASQPKPRRHWKNRYGAKLEKVALIHPAISLVAIQRALPDLMWANYPRGITTLQSSIETRLHRLIKKRRKSGRPEFIDDKFQRQANLEELRAIAMTRSRPYASAKTVMVTRRARSRAIHRYVLARANGICEACETESPFLKPDNSHYLEPHHTTRLADDGPDHPARVVALCPNCHRRAHYGKDRLIFNEGLKKKLKQLESKNVA